jgi:hypothetical protein
MMLYEKIDNTYRVSKTMKPKVLVTREIFDDVLEYLRSISM